MLQDNVRSSQLDPTYVSGRRDAEAEDIQDDDWHMDALQEKKNPADSQPRPLAKGKFFRSVRRLFVTDSLSLRFRRTESVS